MFEHRAQVRRGLATVRTQFTDIVPPSWSNRYVRQKTKRFKLPSLVYELAERRHRKINFFHPAFTTENATPLCCACAATAAASMSSTSACQRCAKERFSAGPLTDDTVISTPSPPSAVAKCAPESASMTSRACTTSPTFSLAVTAPTSPAERTFSGRYFAKTASVVRVAAARPTPPTAITVLSI